MRYFWREKNAEKFLNRPDVKVTNPSRTELEQELILKLAQKLDRIDIIIFDVTTRNEYYYHDKKPKEVLLEGLTEKEIQRKIGIEVVVDFM